MKRILPLLVAICVGCMPLPDETPVKTPDAPQLSRSDLCEQLAGYIAKGRIKTTDDLVRVLRLMKDAGNWTEADSTAVSDVLPDLVTAKRTLTDDDAAKLKSVK